MLGQTAFDLIAKCAATEIVDDEDEVLGQNNSAGPSVLGADRAAGPQGPAMPGLLSLEAAVEAQAEMRRASTSSIPGVPPRHRTQ